MSALINKARKPKFELHLTLYDLNNVPLVQGTSTVKWHLPHSIHAEHRGRTPKCPIDKSSHRVSYNYSKVIPMRISIDKTNNLSECPIEFEVIQEFPMSSSGRDEKITLGVVKINLSEYVEESENFPRRSIGATRVGATLENAKERLHNGMSHGVSHQRFNSKSSAGASSINTQSTHAHTEESNDVVDDEAEEGIVRRYLMQDSKINSTLKIGVLMVQLDGERNYIAPALKTAPMFGGIAGIMAGEQQPQITEPSSTTVTSSANNGIDSSVVQSRDTTELQDMYRHTLAASWSCQPGELPADECIEDIFSGGDGWKEAPLALANRRHYGRIYDEDSNSGSGSPDEAANGTLRPRDISRMQKHMRNRSNVSEKSTLTIGPYSNHHQPPLRSHRETAMSFHNRSLQPNRDDGNSDHDSEASGGSGRLLKSGSHISLTPTLDSTGSDSGGKGRKGGRYVHRANEVGEHDIRDDLVAWKLPGTMT